MDFFFAQDDLERATPDQTRIESLSAEPYPDGARVRISLQLTPFLERPQIDLILRDATRAEIASTSVVEPVTWKLELTMHLHARSAGPYTLEARLFYPDGPAAEPVVCTFVAAPNQ